MTGLADHSSGQAAVPLLRIVRGSPTPEEVAAVVAVVATMGAGDEPRQPAEMAAWADRGRSLRQPIDHGAHAWRASALPH
jgi:hypothetical protein